MIRHYFKTSFRFLSDHKIFSAINLIGLATALSVVYFAGLYVHFEISYDKFNTKASRIYRLSTNVEARTGIIYETSAAPMAPAVQSGFPEVKTATRIFLDYYIVQKDLENFGEETLAYADSSVFSVFTFPLIKGNPSSVFNAPYTMVLSEKASKKYFGTIDCLGKTLLLDGKIQATVTGIMKDIPQNSHLRTDIFLSMSSLINESNNWMTNWSRFGFSTYVLLNKNATADQLVKKMPAFIAAHPLKNNLRYTLSLEPLTGLYFQGKSRGNKAGATVTGNYNNIYIFSIVAFFVLIIACFNFVNLTTAFSLKRSREIGVRKVLGASARQLAFQFLADALFLSAVAFIASVMLCVTALPWFNQVTGKVISTGIFENRQYLILFFLVALITGLLSGIYPAFFLSRLQTINNLKSKFSNISHGISLRRGLVVAQFTISIILIVATIVVYRQLHFMQNDELGFKKEHNLVIDFHYDDRIRDHAETVEDDLTSVPGIQFASVSSCIPGHANSKYATTIEDVNTAKAEFMSDAYFIDYKFITQYGLELVAGRGFSKNFPGDAGASMIVNEAAIKKLGFKTPSEAIGRRFWQRGNSGLIVGVIKDFHFHSLYEEIKPLTMMLAPGFFTFLTLTVSPGHLQGTIKNLEQKWARIAPGLPMIYFFSDNIFNEQYIAQERFGKLFICFALLSISISCLGLIGLASFDTVQRKKEIGVRKVLGASVNNIVMLLTTEFILLVVIAFFFAIPIAWISLQYWLNDFAYRIHLNVIYFFIAGFLALLIALITVSFQAVKAAMANPVKSLRTE